MNENNSCLLEAILSQQPPAHIIKIIEKGEDLEKPNIYGETPLLAAVDLHMPDIVHALIEKGVDVNKGGADGETPLFLAVLSRYYNIAKMLIEAGADILASCERYTPLSVAREKCPEMVGLLKKGE